MMIIQIYVKLKAGWVVDMKISVRVECSGGEEEMEV